MTTRGRPARLIWTLPNALRLHLVELLGVTDTWPQFLRDQAIEHPETLEMLTAARAFPAIEEAVALSRECYVPLRPADLRNRLNDFLRNVTAVLDAVLSHDLMPLHQEVSGGIVDRRRLIGDLETYQKVGRRLLRKAKVETSKSRLPDLRLKGLIWNLAEIFELFSQSTNRTQHAENRDLFITAVLVAPGVLPDGVHCPRNLKRWLPLADHVRFVRHFSPYKAHPKSAEVIDPT